MGLRGPFLFFEIIDYGHVNMCYYLGDSHFCPEIPRNKLKHYFHMLLHSAVSAPSFQTVSWKLLFPLSGVIKKSAWPKFHFDLCIWQKCSLEINIRAGCGGRCLSSQLLRGGSQIRRRRSTVATQEIDVQPELHEPLETLFWEKERKERNISGCILFQVELRWEAFNQ